ncbi:MAG: benzaldehyde dehydrogenase, partial [Rhizorhabdus sp.]
MTATSALTPASQPWADSIYLSGWTRTEGVADVIEPATGDILGRIGQADAGLVAKAAQIAAAAQPGWERTAFDTRAAVLRKVARLIEDRFGDLATWIIRETGSSRMKAEFELGASIRAVHEAAAMPAQPSGLMLPSDRSLLSYARRRALGVVGVISPFNFPFFLSIRAISPALAVGNAALLKPNPNTSISGGLIIAQLFEDAGLPADLLHVVPGGAEIGEAMCSDPNVAMIQFTGSTSVGRQVGEAAGRNLKKVSLEMGGKNSLIILDDADVDLAVANAAWASFMHQGQICFAAGRTLVQRGLAETFLAKLAEKASAIRVGNPALENVELGPLITSSQCRRVSHIVEATRAAGARLHAGGTSEGLFFRPTVLSGVTADMPAFREEIFGPVASITVFDTDEEAVRLANDTEYGLAGAVISRSIGRALAIGDQLKVGILHINDQTVGEEVVNPIAGWGASGNGTGIGGPANWDEFSQWQWVTVKETPPPYPIG